MVAVTVRFASTKRTYTYLGHLFGRTWSWTGRTAKPGTWQSFATWVTAQNGEIISVDRLMVDRF
ncbi:hypothetical protein [Leucobacter chromiiresistens]|uniref:Uncharacterized protein n=1 Tax=Leucobacter chromiiresistens TaxID=1079994 RepID=A0A147ENR2_9MICO|nr:hypothetical protein [Leucobacter chromiiresistens]KTR85980.1 hypothetical protein NS354_06995 [Leucobacter chromiiresistens]